MLPPPPQVSASHSFVRLYCHRKRSIVFRANCDGSGPQALYLTSHADRLFEVKQQLWADETYLDKPFTKLRLREAVALLLVGHTTLRPPRPARTPLPGPRRRHNDTPTHSPTNPNASPSSDAKRSAKKAGALQSAIFNSANFSSIATDAKGVIQIFNVGAERMLGYTAAEVMNKIAPADISDPQEVIARAKALSVELGTPITPGFEALVFKASRGIEDIYELTYIRKDGSRFPAVVSVTALRDAQKAIIGYLLIGTDNTARKQVEEERMKRDQHFYTRLLIRARGAGVLRQVKRPG